MPHAGYVVSAMNEGHGSYLDISDKELLKPITRVIKVTLPNHLSLFSDYMIIHSSILIHAFTHSFMQSFIHPFSYTHSHIHSYNHSFIPYIQSIAYAINSSQRFMLRHKTVVASFNMRNDLPGFEGRPAKGLRPPRVE